MTDEYKGWFVDWIEEWSQFFQPCNWRTFHPLFIEIEDDRTMGGVEATLIILGVGVRFRWNYAQTEKVDLIIAAREKIDAVLNESDAP